jgi:hypothetical protein
MDSFESLSSLMPVSLDETDGTIILSTATERTTTTEEMPLVDSDSKTSGYYPTYCIVA